ncbi:MAG: hypothetical protein ACP6IQ_01935 [Candidatus Njordarchaeia archaeon]
MAKYRIIVNVDEEQLRSCRDDCPEADIEDLIEAEMGWTEESGIVCEDVKPLKVAEFPDGLFKVTTIEVAQEFDPKTGKCLYQSYGITGQTKWQDGLGTDISDLVPPSIKSKCQHLIKLEEINEDRSS